jgi:galactokinase/mevalonate kinase-like predicted kinase
MTATTETRRNVFKLAWELFRSEPTEGFGQALRRAWAMTKKMAAAVSKFARKIAGASTVRLSSYAKGFNKVTTHQVRQIARFGA